MKSEGEATWLYVTERCGWPNLSVTNERAIGPLGQGLAGVLLRVHHDGPVPCNRLLERLARDEQEANAFGAGLDDNLIAAVEKDERMILRVIDGSCIRVDT